jgi:hypothetical protein
MHYRKAKALSVRVQVLFWHTLIQMLKPHLNKMPQRMACPPFFPQKWMQDQARSCLYASTRLNPHDSPQNARNAANSISVFRILRVWHVLAQCWIHMNRRLATPLKIVHGPYWWRRILLQKSPSFNEVRCRLMKLILPQYVKIHLSFRLDYPYNIQVYPYQLTSLRQNQWEIH